MPARQDSGPGQRQNTPGASAHSRHVTGAPLGARVPGASDPLCAQVQGIEHPAQTQVPATPGFSFSTESWKGRGGGDHHKGPQPPALPHSSPRVKTMGSPALQTQGDLESARLATVSPVLCLYLLRSELKAVSSRASSAPRALQEGTLPGTQAVLHSLIQAHTLRVPDAGF